MLLSILYKWISNGVHLYRIYDEYFLSSLFSQSDTVRFQWVVYFIFLSVVTSVPAIPLLTFSIHNFKSSTVVKAVSCVMVSLSKSVCLSVCPFVCPCHIQIIQIFNDDTRFDFTISQIYELIAGRKKISITDLWSLFFLPFAIDRSRSNLWNKNPVGSDVWWLQQQQQL